MNRNIQERSLDADFDHTVEWLIEFDRLFVKHICDTGLTADLVLEMSQDELIDVYRYLCRVEDDLCSRS